MIAEKVATVIVLASVVPAESTPDIIRKNMGISAAAMSSPLSRLLTFLRPIPAMKNITASRQISLDELIRGAVPKTLNVSFTSE